MAMSSGGGCVPLTAKRPLVQLSASASRTPACRSASSRTSTTRPRPRARCGRRARRRATPAGGGHRWSTPPGAAAGRRCRSGSTHAPLDHAAQPPESHRADEAPPSPASSQCAHVPVPQRRRGRSGHSTDVVRCGHRPVVEQLERHVRRSGPGPRAGSGPLPANSSRTAAGRRSNSRREPPRPASRPAGGRRRCRVVEAALVRSTVPGGRSRAPRRSPSTPSRGPRSRSTSKPPVGRDRGNDAARVLPRASASGSRCAATPTGRSAGRAASGRLRRRSTRPTSVAVWTRPVGDNTRIVTRCTPGAAPRGRARTRCSLPARARTAGLRS